MAADRPSGDCGRTLRQARERRGVSLRQIANTTKISVSALEALERNDIAHLPGGIFSRAFIRSYAAAVGLDPEDTVQEFMTQFPQDSVTVGHPASGAAEDHTAVESDRRTATAFLRLIALSIPVAAVVLYFGVAGRPAAVSVPPEPPPPVKRPAAETPAMPVPAPESAAPKVAASEPADRLAVQLSATRPCWISVTVDGEKTVERILQPGEQQALDVHREMVLVAGDAAALAVTLNGALAKPLGRAGEVVTTRLTLNNFKEYLASP